MKEFFEGVVSLFCSLFLLFGIVYMLTHGVGPTLQRIWFGPAPFQHTTTHVKKHNPDTRHDGPPVGYSPHESTL